MFVAALPLLAACAIDVTPRDPIPLLMVVPPGSRAALRESEVLEIGDDILRRRTDLRFASADASGVDRQRIRQCRLAFRLTCWAREAARATNGRAKHLLVVSPTRTVGNEAQLLVVMVPLDQLQPPTDPKTLEDRMFRTARVEEIQVPDLDDGPSLLASALERIIRLTFEMSSHWRSSGHVVVSTPIGASILVDGSTVATATASTTLLVGVPIGERSFSASTEDGTRNESRTTVTAAATARVDLSLLIPPGDPSVALYAGSAVALAGLAIVIAALVAAPSDDYSALCPAGGCPEPRGSSFARPCQLGSDDEACVRDPGGFLVAPFGAALAIVGGGTALGAATFESDTSFPWKSILASVLGGVVFYGVSAIVGGHTPLAR